MSRAQRRAWWVFASCAAAMLAALAWVTHVVVDLERAQQCARGDAEHQGTLRLLWRMDSWLAPQLAREAARPYFEYLPYYPQQKAYNRILGAIEPGEVLTPSPLLTFQSELFLLHFQVAGSELTSPQVPAGNLRDLAESAAVDAAFLRAHAERLAAVRGWLAAQAPLEQRVVAAEAELPPPSCNPAPPNAPQLPLVDAAKLRSQLEYQSRAQTTNAAKAAAPPRAWLRPAGADDVSIGPLLPVWLEADGAERLLFVRRVQTQGQVLLQGFVTDWPRLRATLLAQANDLFTGDAALLQPFTAAGAPPASVQGTLLATVPATFTARAPAVLLQAWSAGRSVLLLAWLAVLAAIAAVAFTLRSTLALGERRARFASAVTHELRTPLTTFRMYSEMLADDMLQDEGQRRDYLETLRRESDRLARLVENVLCYARLEEGRYRGRREPIAAGALLARVTPLLERRAAEVGMGVHVSLQEADGVAAQAVDVEAVEQILFNLVDNACKYAPTPGTPLELAARSDARYLELRLCDHGGGVPPAHRATIFKPFERGARATADSVTPGVGLGLALSRALARDLGGDLRLDAAARDGAGACFVLMLPRATTRAR